MWPWIYLILVDLITICCGTYLVIHDYPGWAAICFVLAATTTIKNNH